MPDIQITKNTSISLGLVFIIVAASVAWGILTTKVVNIEKDVGQIQTQLTALDDKFEQLLMDRNLTLNE